jgi:hypothetical protein
MQKNDKNCRKDLEVDHYGNFVSKKSERRLKGSGPKFVTSASYSECSYKLKKLGK